MEAGDKPKKFDNHVVSTCMDVCAHIHKVYILFVSNFQKLSLMELFRICKKSRGTSLHRSREKGWKLSGERSTTEWLFVKHKMKSYLHPD